MVPTGTFSMTSAPSRPVLLEPSPWRPRSALYSGLKRKWTRVLWRSLDSMRTSPPLPPSPPEGPPRGTNFSRRKATQPLPPSPAFTRIVASSMNTRREEGPPGSVYRGLGGETCARGGALPRPVSGLLDDPAFGRFDEADERLYIFAAIGL